jgi:hypothetical protein
MLQYQISANEILGQYKGKQHRRRFGEESSEFFDSRKVIKWQSLQDPSQTDAGQLSNVRSDTDNNCR